MSMQHATRPQYSRLLLILFLLSACISLEDATPSLPASSPLQASESPLREPLSTLDLPYAEEQEDEVKNLVQLARADLAAALNIKADDVELMDVEPVQWRDTSLGCPLPGMMYAQVITPGYRLTLEVDGQPYVYHTDSGQRVVRCEDDG
jgi:hypothetical protein